MNLPAQPSPEGAPPGVAASIGIRDQCTFHASIDLMDETLREGAERSGISPTLDEKYVLGRAIAGAGIRSMVVGMFPDVPHSIELLRVLLQGQRRGEIAADARFLVISHVGETFRETLRVLDSLDEPLDSVSIIVIHSVSDQQIRHLFPKILMRAPEVAWDSEAWTAASNEERRARNLDWLDGFLPETKRYRGGGIVLGLLDVFRAHPAQVKPFAELAARHGIRQIRLVDTAGTCMPQQIPSYVGDFVRSFPTNEFYCHFHDDFGMATGNAIAALAVGARGVDVSVGGFANRAGHPALAEVAMALRDLYGVTLPGFRYSDLCALSRHAERTYGLIERATQPITGVITHAVLAGIRTELMNEARTIFDVIDPAVVGATLKRGFGIRSGKDGMLRTMKAYSSLLAEHGIEPTKEAADRYFGEVFAAWSARSRTVSQELKCAMDRYHLALARAEFSEEEVVQLICSKAAS